MKNILFLSVVLAAGIPFVSAQSGPLLVAGQPIVGVAATPGSSASAIAVVGTAAGANNYPAAESPSMAIDGAPGSKYLNFAKINTGIIVTPGLTVVTGFQFTAANDAPERDPLTVTIEGTTAANPTAAAGGAAWTTLYTGPSGLGTDPGRFTAGALIPVANGAGFNTYRVLVTDVRNQGTANSMQVGDVQFFGLTNDTAAPIIVNTIPARGATVRSLIQVEVLFNEAVLGVDASDLLINGVAAASLSFGTPEQFIFEFPQPATGTVTIAFAPNHGIRDGATVSNAFAGDNWSLTLDPNAAASSVIINEFMADNESGLRDEDGDTEDWIELYNPGPTAANLEGYYLTDAANNLTKWRIPNVTMAANSYLVIFASGKNRTNITLRLHSNFQLGSGGEYLALIGPATNVISDFYPVYPAQRADVSYGRDRLDPGIVGFYDTPTPNAANATSGRSGFAPDVEYSVSSRTFTSPFTVALSTTSTNAVIRYILITNATLASSSLTNVPTTNSPIYTGPITINMTTELRARTFQTGLFPGNPVTENYIHINNDVRNFSSDIPVVIVHALGSGSVPQSPQTSGILMAFDNDGKRSSFTNAPQVASRMGFHIRGSSTLGQAKSNYRVELWDEFNQDQAYPLLGMPADSDWVLLGLNGFDPTLMHNAIYQWLGKQLGVPSMRNRYVEVFRKIDSGPVTTNDYFGLYLLLETPKVGDDRLDIAKLTDQDTNAPAITGGYLMKIDRVDTERSFNPPAIGGIRTTPSAIAFVDPPFKSTETDSRRLMQINYFQNYINRFLTNLSSPGYTNPVTGYAQFIDPDQWINHLLANIIPFNVDGYRLSGYFYKDRNGRLEQGPMWDCDRCLGTGGTATPQADNRCYNPRMWRGPANDVGTDNGTDFFGISNVGVSWFTPLFRDPDFWQSFIDRYQAARTNEYSSNTVVSQVNAFHNEIKEAQVREQLRWGGMWMGSIQSFTYPRAGVQTVNFAGTTYSFDFGPADNFGRGRYSNEVAFQKKWLMDRLDFMDTNFLNMPKLSSGTALVPSGTVITAAPATKANSILLYTLDGTDPRAPGGGVSPSALMSSGTLTLTVTTNVRLFARSYNTSHANMTNSGTEVGKPLINSFWSGPVAATYYTTVPQLSLTELMFHPSPPSLGDTNDADNFEFIEFKNNGSTALNLAGFNLSGGINLTFTNFMVGPGQYFVVVNNVAAFQSRYGTTPSIAGVFQGNLANDGDHVVLRGPLQEPILDFVYQDGWFPLTDSHGFSLVVQDESGAGNLSTNTSWRQSNTDGGSPGLANPAAAVVSDLVLVNEALTHTDLPSVDVIELYNAGTNDVNIGGWWLTDDFTTPKKYQIPNGTILPAGSYLLFDETQFNPVAGGPDTFALGSNGDDLYVFSGSDEFITGYYHGFDFGAAQNGRTFGRYVNSQTNEHFVAQVANTLGTNNLLPLVGPVVISEIMFHPPEASSEGQLVDNSFDEFIELFNITATNVPLHHVFYPSNTWRLSSAVDFSFPPNTSIAPLSSVLVVSFDPAQGGAAFRAKYGIPAAVPLFGPYSGKLDNSAESVRLSRPDAPNGPEVPFILVDRLDYQHDLPWPVAADGFGASLHKLVLEDYGNDPTNWLAARPTPGAALEGGAPPVIVQQPSSVTVVEGMTTNISVVVTSPTAATYQWQQDSNSVPGATSATLVFTNAQLSQGGSYRVSVFNGGGSVLSATAQVTVLPVPVIATQPASQNVLPGTNFTIFVSATGTGPLRYQWRFNGVNISGATNTSISYTGANLNAHAGVYDVTITDNVGIRFSDPATIIVLVKPYSTSPVAVTVVQGQTARFSISPGPIHPLLPLNIRWLRNGVNWMSNAPATLVIPNAQSNGTFRAVVSSIAGSTNTVAANLTVLPDGDGDGIPDSFENAYFPPGSATNALNGSEDPDADTMSNVQEYIAGTNPTNGLSYLRVEPLKLQSGNAILEFAAVSNRNYNIQFRDTFDSGVWTNLFAVPAAASNRTLRFTNTITTPMRFFRIEIPSND